jgi:hypothetical protein
MRKLNEPSSLPCWFRITDKLKVTHTSPQPQLLSASLTLIRWRSAFSLQVVYELEVLADR